MSYPGSGMICFRDTHWQRFGATLTGLALSLQLLLSSLSLVIAAPGVNAADAFGGHALCLAGGAAPPAEDTPAAPTQPHLTFCCLWHQLPGIEPAAISPPLPVAFAPIAPNQPSLAAFIPGPRRGPANARAPPTPA
jgi:DUF2946 family protein